MTQWHDEMIWLQEQLTNHGIDCSTRSCTDILQYCQAVAESAVPADLVSPGDLPYLVSKHVAASLGVFLVERPQPGESWVDVGTGGGFPGMVVKLNARACQMTLVDSSRKKVAFLEQMRESLRVEGLQIVHGRVEERDRWEGQWPGFQNAATARRVDAKAAFGFDVILARAVASLKQTLEWVDRLSRPGTRLLTFKGPAWKADLQRARTELDARHWRFDSVHQIPWAKPRILRLVKKADTQES